MPAPSLSAAFLEPLNKEEQQPTVATDAPADERQPTQLEHALKQRKGDWRVLQYYVLRMGLKGMVLYALLMVVFTFFYGFARKSCRLASQSQNPADAKQLSGLKSGPNPQARD
jgi:hypothetical protein